jgi:predicted NUDIX family phosphoesterase
MTGVEREMNEELVINSPFSQNIVALINDDSNDVGKVHIGIVHLFNLTSPDVVANEAPITDLSFLSLESLAARRDQLESWSQICLDHLHLILP